MGELRTILPYFRPYMRSFYWGTVLVFFANLFQVIGPYLIKLSIDSLSEPGTTAGRIGSYAGLIVLAALLGGAARYGMRELLNGMSRRIECDLRDDFFRHLLSLDAAFYNVTRTGDLMSRATNDTLAVRMAVGPAIMYTANTAVSFVFAFSLMIWLSPKLTLLAMVPMVVLPPFVIGFGRIIHRRFEEIQEQFSSLSTFVQENLTGEYRSKNMRLVITAGAFHPILMLVAGTAMVVVTWFGSLEVMAGSMSLGDFVAFGFYLTLLIWPMIALGWVVNLYQRGAASMGRLNKILRAEPMVAVPADPVSIEGAHGRIEFRNVSFRYPDTERMVLSGINFVAEAGETIAIIGPTGSGKSTLVSLIARIYDPTEGDVLLDEISLDQVEPAELRLRLGMVPQDSFLFSDTIAHNVGLGLSDDIPLLSETGEPADVITDATGIAQLHDQIQAFPKAYDTMLGERGINLSGGQKQRATLARALARDPLVLVLDDALSAVDTHTEARILEDLRSVMKGRTSFIISHRVSAIMNADRILVLEDGMIVERGTHAELLGTEGTYARLLERQLRQEVLESEVAATGGD
jgi:ATP-binding cassette subfamily B multidrug efflux pump